MTHQSITHHPTEKGIMVSPARDSLRLIMRELWQYRDLIVFLAWRDLAVRYKQTILGTTLVFLRPLFQMLIYTLLFGIVLGVPSEGIPYPVFAFAGFLPWQLFTAILSSVSESLVGNSGLLSKVYFPRLVLPVSSVLPALADFSVSFLIFGGMMVYYGIGFTWNVIWIFPILLLVSCMTFGAGLWLAALNVEYRDARYIVPMFLQLLMYASPIVYSSSMVPVQWQSLYKLNPIVGIITAFRWSISGTEAPGWEIWVSIIVTLILLASGFVFFRRTEETFVDVV
jgi:lipopolysaccharide transport system permease protein